MRFQGSQVRVCSNAWLLMASHVPVSGLGTGGVQLGETQQPDSADVGSLENPNHAALEIYFFA